MPHGKEYSAALRESRKRAEAPFKAPFFTEPNHVYKSRKGAQLAFRKKHEVLREHVKSVYVTPGLHTDDYHHHTTQHIEPLPPLRQTDKVRTLPESFSVIHTFKSYDRRVKERPQSAGSIATEKSSIYDDKEQNNDFKESRGHSRFTLAMLQKRPQSASGEALPDMTDPEVRQLKYSKVHALLAAQAKKRSSKTRDKESKARELREQREAELRRRQEKARRHEQRQREQEAKKYPTLENMHKHQTHHEEYKRFKGTKIDLMKYLPPTADPFQYNTIKPRPRDFEVNANDLMTRNEYLLLHPPQKPVVQPITACEVKLALSRGVDVAKKNEALCRLQAEFSDPEVTAIEKRVVERELHLVDGNLRPRHDGSRGGFKITDGAGATPAGGGKGSANRGAVAAVPLISKGGVQGKLRSLVMKTSVGALRRLGMGLAKSACPTDTKNDAAATNSRASGRPSSAPHSKVKQLHRDPFYYDSLHHKERHSHEHIGLGNGEVVRDKRRNGHSAYIYVDSTGKIHVQLKSKALKTRPKSAEMSKFKSYKDKKRTLTMLDVVKVLKGGKATKTHGEEHGIAEMNLPSKSRELIVNNTLPPGAPATSAASAGVDFDFEAADRRRLKSVQFNRERLSQISAKNLKLKEYIKFIASKRDVNLQEGKKLVQSETGKLGTITRERLAMEKIYHSMGGHSWRRKDNWLSDRPLEEWFGVTTNHLGAVRDLRLDNNFLSGELAAALSDLEFLEVLVLDNNGITGPLHGHVITGWKYVEVLSIRSNRLEGSVPLNLLAKNQLLRELWLSDNQLSGTLHEDIGAMQSLTHFCVYKNQLSGAIPSTIGRLSSLELLSLGRNKFGGPIPDALRSCIRLTHLSLHSNDFTGCVPEYFSTFPQLLELNLWRNLFDGDVPLRVAREVWAEKEREGENERENAAL